MHHKNPVTCVAQYRTHVYTGSKNGIVEKWDIKDTRRPVRLNPVNREKNKLVLGGHIDDVISIALSNEGKFLATGGTDKRICIWATSTMTHLKTFSQHRGPVMVIYRVLLSNIRVLSAVPQPTNCTPQVPIERLNYGP
jgi:WD40 repeat protein